MNKSPLSLFLAILIVVSLVLVTNVHFGKAQASSTNVNGIITKDTTLTLANSPYSLTGPVAVNTGVTLTIEAGATVNLNGNQIQINGILVAKGTNTNRIQFSGGTITFTSINSGWSEETGSGSIIQYANLSSSTVNVQSPAKIDHDSLNGNILMSYVVGASCGIISNNTVTASYGDGISCSGNASILDNTVTGALWGGIDAFSGSPTIQGNLVTGNMGWSGAMSQGGIVVRNGGNENVPTTPLIEDNTVTNNNLGITIGSQSSQAISPTISNNNVYGNQKYNFYLNQLSYNITAINNWWGTTDTQAIGQTIYDYKNNFNLGNVTFAPFLSASDPYAPSQTYNPNPTPTPSPSPTPSPTSLPTTSPTSPSASPPVSQSSTATPTVSSTVPPSSSPTAPEFPPFAILVLCIAAIATSIALVLRKQGKNKPKVN